MTDLAGKVVVVTGASRGIGEATAREFAAKGAKVALLARSNEAIQAIASEIGSDAMAVTCDVSSNTDVEQAIEQVVAAFGSVDILVNNAGVIEPIAMIADSDPEAWSKAIDINIKGVYYASRAVLAGMEAKGEGSIITIGSGAAHGALEGWSHYATSKAGALMITKAFHTEAGPKGIRSVNLSPGTVATQMQVDIKASGINVVSELDPSVHIPASWPARACVWLAGPHGEAFAGQEVSLRDEDIQRRVGLIS